MMVCKDVQRLTHRLGICLLEMCLCVGSTPQDPAAEATLPNKYGCSDILGSNVLVFILAIMYRHNSPAFYLLFFASSRISSLILLIVPTPP